MGQPLRIDPYALCASPFAAPAVIAAVGNLLNYSNSKAGFLSILFWQCLYAFELAPFFLVVTIPVCWLLARFVTLPKVRTRSLAIRIALAGVSVAVASNIPFFAHQINPDMAIFILFLVGAGFNVLTFIWLSSPPNTAFERDAPKAARPSI